MSHKMTMTSLLIIFLLDIAKTKGYLHRQPFAHITNFYLK